MIDSFVRDLEADILNTADDALFNLSHKATDIQMRLRRREEVDEAEVAALATLVADALGAFRLRGIARATQRDYEKEACR